MVCWSCFLSAFQGAKKKRNQWNSAVLARSLCKPLATGKNASELCFPRGWQLLNIVKGLFFYLAAANCEIPLYPGGLASVTMPKHLRPFVSPPKQGSDACGRFIKRRWENEAGNKVCSVIVCCYPEKYLPWGAICFVEVNMSVSECFYAQVRQRWSQRGQWPINRGEDEWPCTTTQYGEIVLLLSTKHWNDCTENVLNYKLGGFHLLGFEY